MSDREAFARLLIQHFSLAGNLSPEQADRLALHFELLSRWNRVVNLTSIRSTEGAVVRHYCESLFVAVRLPSEPVSVLDVGSGAGFPGIPMAVLRPDCSFTLSESRTRKAAFLLEATREMPNVRVVTERAESLNATFDWVVSRAVAWKNLRRYAPRLGRTLALLLSATDAQAVRSTPGFRWQAPLTLPWGHNSALLVGCQCFT